MKKMLFFIVGTALTFLSLSAQQADIKVGELINKSDWFTLEEVYPELKDSIQTPFLKVLAEIMISNNFNRPDDALEKIGELLSGYQQDIGFDNACNMVVLMSVIEGVRGNYAQAADYLKDFIGQLKRQEVNMDFGPYETLYNTYNELREYPAPGIFRPDEDVEIPVSIEPVELLKPIDGEKFRGLGINIPVTIHDKEYEFIFDTGAGTTYMSERFAKEVGIKIIKDSLLINEGMMGEGYGMKGFLDSLQIGNIVFRNIMVAVGKSNAVDSIVRIDGVLGMDFMRLMPEIQIDTRNRKIIFPVTTTPLPETGRNLLLTHVNQLILKAYAGNDRLLFFFDTGNNKADLFYSYYNRYKDDIDLVAKKDSVTGGGFGYVRTKEILLMPAVKFKVGETPVEMKNIRVHFIAENDQTREDGNLGMDLVKLFDKTIINFKDMFVKFQ